MSKPLSDIEERLIWKPEEFLRRLKGTVVAKVRYALTVGKHFHVQISKSNSERNAIIDAADSMRTRVSTALMRTVEAVKDAIPLKMLEDKLQQVDLNGVLQVLDLDNRFQAAAKGAGLQPDETSFLEAIKDTWEAGARAELDSLNTVPVHKSEVAKADTIGLMLAFDLLNPETIAWLSTYVMALIRQVSDETRRAIADVVMNAFQYGGHPYEQARTIRNMIGLTQQQSQAVANFRRMLENEPLAALTRDLRDHRFDATLREVGRMKGQLSKEQIDKMADRYYSRYLKYRAECIARTETIRAARQGQEETWRQAIKQGLLPQGMKRKWIVTYDDRLCSSCRSIPKLNPEGRGMDEQFMSDIGVVDGPPLHPHCRCAIVRKVDWGVSKVEEVEKGGGNPCHKPAGTSEGGQFCETGGGKSYAGGVVTEKIDPDTGEYFSEVNIDKLIERGKAIDKKVTPMQIPSAPWGAPKPKSYMAQEKEVDVALKSVEKRSQAAWKKFNALPLDVRSKEKAEKLSTELDGLMAEMITLVKRKMEIRSQADSTYANDLHYTLRVANGLPKDRIAYNISPSIMGAQREVIVNGTDWFTTRIGAAKLPANQAVAGVERTSQSRSFADGKVISLSNGASSDVVVHEMGHWLEHSRDDVRSAATQFLQRRFDTTSRASDIKPLATLTGDASYAPHEVAFKDKFSDPYVGKVYTFPNGQVAATEVVSMGVQHLFSRPVQFRSADPEHYYFTLGLLNYVSRNPNPAAKSTGAAPFRSEPSMLGREARYLSTHPEVKP